MHTCSGGWPISACTNELSRVLQFGSIFVETYNYWPTQRSQIFNIKPVWDLSLASCVTCWMKPVIRKLKRHVAPMEFSLSDLCYITADKWKESQHEKLEAHLCLRKQIIQTGCVPTLKSEEAESDCLKQRWVVLSDLKVWVNCGCVCISDNIRVSLRAMLNWEYEHVWPLNVSENTNTV